MKLTYKFLSLILVLAMLAGCTAAPTLAPTVTTTTTPLPTATLEPTATITFTPTPEPTPAPAALPVPEEPFPTSVTEQLITDERLANQKKDFEILTQNDPAVKTEALRLAERLKAIGGETTTSKNIVDGNRWGVIPSCDGKPCILQKTTDGGTTWAVVPDASAYAELIANPLFAKENYRLAPLGRPVDLQEGATVEVISQNSWLIYAWRDAKSGKILAWFDAANDQYSTVDGKKLKILEPYAPFTENTTPENCKQNIVHSPLTNPAEFQKDVERLHAYDQEFDQNDLSPLYINVLSQTIVGAPDNWKMDVTYAERFFTSVKSPVCAELENSNNHEMPIFILPISFQLVDGSRKVINLPIVVDNTMTLNYIIDKLGKEKGQAFFDKYYSIQTRINNLHTWDQYEIAFLVDEKILDINSLPDDYKPLAEIFNYTFQKNIVPTLMKAIRIQATSEDLEFLQKNAIIVVYGFTLTDDPNITLKVKNP